MSARIRPLLPCRDLGRMAQFYSLLGFEVREDADGVVASWGKAEFHYRPWTHPNASRLPVVIGWDTLGYAEREGAPPAALLHPRTTLCAFADHDALAARIRQSKVGFRSMTPPMFSDDRTDDEGRPIFHLIDRDGHHFVGLPIEPGRPEGARPRFLCRDHGRTSEFYHRIGFDVGPAATRILKEFVVGLAGAEIDYAEIDDRRLDPLTQSACCLFVDDLAATYAAVAHSGVRFRSASWPSLRPPRTDAWSRPAFNFTDPDANLVWCVQA